MNTIYLVCTRSALSASALVYIINQSPDFYNICHDRIWLCEKSEKFGEAHTLNDYWNIPPGFTHYNKEIRNAESLSLENLQLLYTQFSNVIKNKNIALFTHAQNINELNKIVKDNNLNYKIITTQFGYDSHHFVNSWAKREYNPQMQPYESKQQALHKLAFEVLKHDQKYVHEGTMLQMYDWLKNTPQIYHTLGISENKDIYLWVDQYLKLNMISFLREVNLSVDPMDTMACMQGYVFLLNNFRKKNSVNLSLLYANSLMKLHINEKLTLFDADKKTRELLDIDE